MKKIIVLLLSLVGFLGHAQLRLLNNFTLEVNPKLSVVDSMYKDESLVFVKDHRSILIEYSYPSSSEIHVIHKIIKVQDDIGVKEANILQFPVGLKSEVINLEIRTISSLGKVNKIQVEDLKDVETKDGFKSIAIENVEVNGQIEYLYTYRRPLSQFGRIHYRSPYPIQDLKFDFYNSALAFNLKGYNAIPDPEIKENHLSCHVKNLNPLPRQGALSASSKKNYIDYRLVKAGNNSKMSTWQQISKGILNNFKFLKGKESAMRFMADLNLENKSQEEKIYAIENKIKTSIVVENKDVKSYTNISEIIKTKLTNPRGQTILYVYCLQLLKIPVDFIMTTSRFDGEIDETFPTSLDLRKLILYFPELNLYLDPSNKVTRLGLPPFEFANSRSLLIHTKSTIYNPSYTYVNHGFISLPMLKARYNTMQINCSTNLNQNNDELMVNYEHKTTGYEAFMTRFHKQELVNEEGFQSEFIRGINDLDIKSYEFFKKEISFSQFPLEPFLTKAVLQSESLVETIDSDILVHLGKLIGTQTKLYNEKNRIHDIVLDFPKLLNYKIEFKIPEGYKCQNLEALKSHIHYTLNDKNNILFSTSYSVENGLLKINVQEAYNAYTINKSQFDKYKEVMNASADFNAFTLLLEKI